MQDLIINRKSTRYYTGEKINKDVVAKILLHANLGPKAGNKIRWVYHVISNKDDILFFSKRPTFYQYFIANASHLICVDLDEEGLYEDYGKRGVDLYGIQGSAAAIQNLLLAASSYGVGNCWIGSFDEELVKNKLNSTGKIVAIITLGISEQTSDKEREPINIIDTNIIWRC